MSEAPGRYTVKTDASMSAALRNNIKLMDKKVGDPNLSYQPPTVASVRTLMQIHVWTQAFVADLVGVNVSTVRRWMSEPRMEDYSRIPYGEWLLLLIFSGEITLDQVHVPFQDNSIDAYPLATRKN